MKLFKKAILNFDVANLSSFVRHSYEHLTFDEIAKTLL